MMRKRKSKKSKKGVGSNLQSSVHYELIMTILIITTVQQMIEFTEFAHLYGIKSMNSRNSRGKMPYKFH